MVEQSMGVYVCEGGRNVRQRHTDNQQVNLLLQEVVQVLLRRPAVPRAGQTAIRVPCAGDNEALIPLRLGRLARTRRVRNHIHPHRLRHFRNYTPNQHSRQSSTSNETWGRSLTLPPNTPIPQHPHPLPHPITHPHPRALIPPPLPLQIIQLRIPMAMHQVHHHHPLRDLRAVHAIRAAQRDLAIRVDRMISDVIRARGKKLNQLRPRNLVRGFGQPEEGGDVAGLREQVGRDVVDGDFSVLEVRVEVLDAEVVKLLLERVDACLALFFGPGEDCEDEFLLFWDRFGRCFGSAAHYDHLVSDSLGVGLFGSRVYCLALRLWNSMDCTSRFECCTLRVYNGCCRARWGPMWGQQPVDVLPC